MTVDQTTPNHPHIDTECPQLHCGNNVNVLRSYPDGHFDAIVTDPPYGIEFLGKAWDKHTGAVETWRECLRVLKPGGHLLAFSAARTYHHLATNIESVGFEIRDQLMWIYSSGFPKAQDIGKALDKRGITNQSHGWKTALKPGHEPIVMARKPMRGSTMDNVIQHGVGALNIDATRIAFDQQLADWYRKYPEQKSKEGVYENYSAENRDHKDRPRADAKPGHESIVMARKPFKGSTIDNIQRHGVGALNIDATRIESEPFEYCADGLQRTTYSQSEPSKWSDSDKTMIVNDKGRYPSNVLGEIADYQKYFYCPKVSRRERHCGFEQDNLPKRLMPMPGPNGHKDIRDCLDKDWANKKDPLAHLPTESSMLAAVGGYYVDAAGNRTETKGKNIWTPTTGQVYVHGLTKIYEDWCQTHNQTTQVGNNHPTVKPVALMRYLIQLVTPNNSVVLDPFMGSGSTGMAACELGHTFVGIDQDPRYVQIAHKRIQGWTQTQTASSHPPKPVADTDLFDDLFE